MGIKTVRIQGLQALSSTGLFEGIRAMASRIFKIQPWRKPGEKADCRYGAPLGGTDCIVFYSTGLKRLRGSILSPESEFTGPL